ncbi:DUF3052 family protein [Arcanobacterium pinnipediorum]|uniref:DUF3052 domain-containing protein n=1 Tax=Arcanobacterium pinnipediorum TaxID=1503041 RepID=A0ABY5AJD0_9ACTO|nr:DUF3052 family protein [Arcanobacterium pinnipediorum]USR80076.1 DUF3052 domain-containing protein [Arcanobacterium pinnipediorum]
MSGSTGNEAYGFGQGAVVQEFGYDDDVVFELRDEIEAATGNELEDEDYRGVADGVLAWWRSDDGDVDDLTDYLVDAAASLDSDLAVVWLLVPAPREELHVPVDDVNDAAKTAGMSVTRSMGVDKRWTAYRITVSRSR